MVLLTELCDLCALAISGIESYLCLMRLRKLNEDHGSGLRNQLKSPQTDHMVAAMLQPVHIDMSQTLDKLQEANIRSQCGILRQYRSLINALTSVRTLIDMVQEHLSKVAKKHTSEDRKSDVSDADMISQMNGALFELKWLQYGCQERGIISLKDCVRDVEYALKSGVLAEG